MIPTNEPPAVVLTPDVNDREIKDPRHARLLNCMAYSPPWAHLALLERSRIGHAGNDLWGIDPNDGGCATAAEEHNLG